MYLVVVVITILSISHSIQSKALKEKTGGKQAKDTKEASCKKPEPLNKKFDLNQCDLVTEGPICLFNGDRILLPFASPKGLLGYWNFDENKPLDNSGNRNHGVGIVNPGAAFGGFGSSAYFSEGNYLEIPYNPAFQSSDFTISFWLFVVQDFFSASKGVRFCPLIQRGKDDLFSKNFQRNPALYFDRKEKNLKFFVKTTDENSPQGESLTSNAKVTSQRWLHIAIVRMGSKLKIYVNGILDAQVLLKSDAVVNDSALYIGNVPWLKDQCDYPFLIDELRYYNIAVEEDKIQAEASPVLGGLEPSFLQLGCMNCSLKEASQACVDGYRLCTSIELHTGGYQIARSMGWLNWNTHLWTHGAMKTPADFADLKGLALCCAELK